MKEITIQIPDDCEVQIVKKKNIFKKGDVIVSNSGLIAIYEYTKIENNKKVVYYSTLYSTAFEIFMSLNQINNRIGDENNCCLATQEQKEILINALKLKAKTNNEAKTVLKEVFNIYEPIIRTYQDLIDYKISIQGAFSNNNGDILITACTCSNLSKRVAASEKVAKSMLAMAMISQLMPYYGGAISDEEWTNSKTKYVIVKISNEIQKDDFFRKYHFLAFHTKEQRDDFLKYNEQLVKDYLMIE